MVFIVVPLPFQHKLNYFHFAELLKNYLLFVQIFHKFKSSNVKN